VVAQRGQAPAGLKTLIDSKGRLAQRYDLQPGTTYLARPDQHVAARWRGLRRRQGARPPWPAPPATPELNKETSTMPLNTQPNFCEPGKRYFQCLFARRRLLRALIDTHRDLSDEQSAMVNARLILLLANHIGDIAVLREAMQIAREGV
jgi:hypothetical protein